MTRDRAELSLGSRQAPAAEIAAVVNCASSKAGAEAVVGRITDRVGTALAVRADVSKPEDVARLFAEVATAFGKPDHG